MKKLHLYAVISLLSTVTYGQDKIALDHSVYDSWNNITGHKISDNGEWISYEINPGKGDGWLFFHNPVTGKKDSIPRGYGAGRPGT